MKRRMARRYPLSSGTMSVSKSAGRQSARQVVQVSEQLLIASLSSSSKASRTMETISGGSLGLGEYMCCVGDR